MDKDKQSVGGASIFFKKPTAESEVKNNPCPVSVGNLCLTHMQSLKIAQHYRIEDQWKQKGKVWIFKAPLLYLTLGLPKNHQVSKSQTSCHEGVPPGHCNLELLKKGSCLIQAKLERRFFFTTQHWRAQQSPLLCYCFGISCKNRHLAFLNGLPNRFSILEIAILAPMAL